MDPYDPPEPYSRKARLQARQYAKQKQRQQWLKQRLVPSSPALIAAVIGLLVLGIIAGAIQGSQAANDLNASAPSAGAVGEESSVPGPEETTSATPASDNNKPVTVHVVGQVQKPGVYEMPPGSRIGQAIEKAGGVIAPNQLDALNLAQPLQDGQQIRVPKPGEAAPNQGTSSSAQAPTEGGKINLNQADQAQLEKLEGVGPTTAKKIIEFRESQGSFRSLSDLKRIDGIGEKKYATISAQVTL